jgi:hypothetical protein
MAIQAPYVDLNVGSPNVFLTLSNTINPIIPNWSGEVDAWSTRWTSLDTNTGITYDYGVLMVGSFLRPTAEIDVQNLIVHGTNNLVISDSMNVLGTLYSDARSLTLTTNGLSRGAYSIEGELNIRTPSIFFGTSLPNLRNLTNNGALRFPNLAQFAGSSDVVDAVPEIPAAAAIGMLSEKYTNKNVSLYNKVIIGTNTYKFVSVLTNSVPNLVKIGSKFDASMSNLISAINRGPGAGTNYSKATVTNLLVTAGALSNHSFVVTAKIAGTYGNSILTTNSASATNLTWNGHLTLYGGANAVTGSTNISTVTVPYENFISTGRIIDQGTIIWTRSFVNSGIVSNGAGSFQLKSTDAIVNDGPIVSGGDISLDVVTSLNMSNLIMQAGGSLLLNASYQIAGTNGTSIFVVGGASGVGFSLPNLPQYADLLGTIITNTAATNKNVVDTWSGTDFGTNSIGFNNNAAIGLLSLVWQDDRPFNGQFTFTGTGISNAIYVGVLDLRGSESVIDSSFNVNSLVFNTNLVIYYGDARVNGVSRAAELNGKNGGHLRWIPSFTGRFNLVSVVYPGGKTNLVNTALVARPTIAPSFQMGSGLQLSVNGSGVLTTVQASTNMVDWVNVYSGYPPFTFNDVNAVNFEKRYYRVVIVP